MKIHKTATIHLGQMAMEDKEGKWCKWVMMVVATVEL